MQDKIIPKPKVKKICLKCRYYTKKEGHKRCKCYTNRCPAKWNDINSKKYRLKTFK